jgi:predicted 3-demethylubiquinone-9 3-methyltransferase (glyoxalase superfamily)
MSTTVRPFLMFQGGQAEEAMNFYVSLFDDGKIVEIVRWPKDGPGAEGSVMGATFHVAGQDVMCLDSPVKHNFTFTPAISMFITCESEAQIEKLASALGEGGSFLMPLNSYGFSKKFAWVNDRYGVSWQINLPN